MKVNLLLYTFLLSCATGPCKKSDIHRSRIESWITDRDLSTVVRLSFPSSKCCNVFFDDSIEDSETLFRRFRSVYPYEYLLKRSVHECNGYLLLGANDEQIGKSLDGVPLLWKTEILIIVSNNVSNNSSILNDSLYGIANVNIVSMSGIWSLSENYLKPRIFNKLDRYEELVHDYNNFDLRGRELQICTIFRPPMTYLNRTVNKTIDSVQADVYATNNDLQWDGIEVQLLLTIAKKLNFTFTVRYPEGNTRYGAPHNATLWKGGLIAMADIAFAGIWMTQLHRKFVDLSEPWHVLYIYFLVPRPRRTTSFWALVKPFAGKIWASLGALFLLAALYLYARAWIDSKFPKRFRSFFVGLIDLIGCFLSSSVPSTTANNKLPILLWQTAGWLIITAYCSSLAAKLATSQYENRIDTIEQFLAANLSWGNMGEPPPFRDYFDLTNPYSAQLPSKYRTVNNVAQLKKLITDGHYAIPGKIVDNYFFPDHDVPNNDLKMYATELQIDERIGGTFQCSFRAPAVASEAGEQGKCIDRCNHRIQIILLLKQTGITVWHLRSVIRRRTSYSLREVREEHDGYDGSVQVLGLTPLAAGFSLLLVGSFLATFMFYLEVKRVVASTYVRQVLRRVTNESRCLVRRRNRHRNDIVQ
ncbi:uncharacterized protein LOC143152464 isoform X2 [Ptiloglossa arizonensis]|uniref:uncharacterized protein LOC143152464 isoform X2 n=1 Tax=Ptiloglossa arizonensis TaxID=3350558 RepID=UPI003FA121B8